MIVTPADLERLQREDADADDGRENLRAMRAAFADIPQEQRERDVVAVVAQMRAEREAERATSDATS